MSADGIPHKAAIIVIGRLNCPTASGVSDATDVPEKKNRLRGGTEIRVCENLFADDLHGVTTVPRQSREPVKQRSQFAQLSRLVSAAARQGDELARALFTTAAGELVELVNGVRAQLQIPADLELQVSGSGGLFQGDSLLTAPFEAALSGTGQAYCFSMARFPPHAGAALQAARLGGIKLSKSFLLRLRAGI